MDSCHRVSLTNLRKKKKVKSVLKLKKTTFKLRVLVEHHEVGLKMKSERVKTERKKQRSKFWCKSDKTVEMFQGMMHLLTSLKAILTQELSQTLSNMDLRWNLSPVYIMKYIVCPFHNNWIWDISHGLVCEILYNKYFRGILL